MSCVAFIDWLSLPEAGFSTAWIEKDDKSLFWLCRKFDYGSSNEISFNYNSNTPCIFTHLHVIWFIEANQIKATANNFEPECIIQKANLLRLKLNKRNTYSLQQSAFIYTDDVTLTLQIIPHHFLLMRTSTRVPISAKMKQRMNNKCMHLWYNGKDTRQCSVWVIL